MCDIYTKRKYIVVTLNETQIKKAIGEIVENMLEGRNLLRIPNSSGEETMNIEPENEPPMSDELSMEQPQEEPIEQPQQEFSSPHISELVELLNANPDRAEGILNYAKGIIGNDHVPTNNNDSSSNMEQPPVSESRNFDLDEMISDIIGGGNSKNKQTITRPIGKVSTIKGKMFRPSMGIG